MRLTISYILLFAAQVVVLNHLDFSMYLKPQLFILILISLPPYLNRSLQMIIAFGLGLMLDLFVSTPGLHASACMLLILLRMFLVNRMDVEEILANHDPIRYSNLGSARFLFLSGILVLVYHLYVFGIESIGAVNIVNYFLTVLISSVATYTLILLIQYLYSSN